MKHTQPEPAPDLDQIATVTGSGFTAEVLQADGPIAVEFMTYGCPHCKAIEPVLQRVAEMVKSKERIFRVNVAVELELANYFDIRFTPTMVMFLDGREVGRVNGLSPTVASVLTAVTHPFQTL
jgi:thioredoxin 1